MRSPIVFRQNIVMSTVFELIIEGQIPGRFVWADDICVAIMTIEPVAPGHALVIPRVPVDKWTDLSEGVLDHIMNVAQKIGRAQEVAFEVPRTAVVIAGFEVPHTHVHVIPAHSEAQASLANASAGNPQELDEAASRLRRALVEAGFGGEVPYSVDSPSTH